MKLSPHLEAKLEAEQERRAANWLELVPPLCGVPSQPLTPRMVLDLHLAGNPLVTGSGRVHRRHMHDVLWRLHPHYSRPHTGGVRAALQRGWVGFWLRRRVWRLDVALAAREIRQRMTEAYLDAPAGQAARGDPTAAPSPFIAQPCWIDSLVCYAAARYAALQRHPLDVPFALHFQLRRAEALAGGEDIIDPIHETLQLAVKAAANVNRLNPKS